MTQEFADDEVLPYLNITPDEFAERAQDPEHERLAGELAAEALILVAKPERNRTFLHMVGDSHFIQTCFTINQMTDPNDRTAFMLEVIAATVLYLECD